MSSIISRATVSNCQGPRYAVRPGVLVNTHLVREGRIRQPVRTGEDHPDGGGHEDRPRDRIRTDVLDEVDRRRLVRPVGVERHPHPALLTARRTRHQVLTTVLDVLERGRHLARGEQHADVLAVRVDLLAERTTGVAGDHPDAVLGHGEQACGEHPQVVR